MHLIGLLYRSRSFLCVSIHPTNFNDYYIPYSLLVTGSTKVNKDPDNQELILYSMEWGGVSHTHTNIV